ncbi:MAG: hypothetical protein JWM80_184 [Cyanobacteria bacterium RYN_339]|nr:hypothetical protein [Cyanobacteria bacterium RYN_339]
MDELTDLRAQITRLSGELAGLSSRLAVLEANIEAPSPISGEVPGRAEGAGAGGGASWGAIAATDTPSASGTSPARGEGTSFSWEALIGGQAALWLGSAAIFLAMAFGLAYAWATIPPIVRVAGGFGLAIAFLAASALTRKRSQRWFPDGLAGAGLALSYLDAWTGYATHHLFGNQAAFGLMALTTLAGIWLAVRFDAMVIGVLATLGGFVTPLVIGGESDTPWALFTYIAILDLNVLGAALFKRWPALGWLGFLGTAALAVGWSWGGHHVDPWALAGWYTLFFLEFAAAATVYAARRREDMNQHDVLMLVAAACTYAPATYFTLEATLGAAKAGFPLGLAVACGAIALAARRVAPANRAFHDAAAGLGILFASIALPIQLDADWYAVAWVVEGTLLWALGLRLDSQMLRRWGYLTTGLGALIAMSVIETGGVSATAIFSPHALPMTLSVAAGILMIGLDPRPKHPARVLLACWVPAAVIWLLYATLHPEMLGVSTAAGLGLALYALSLTWGGTVMRGAGFFLAGCAGLWLCEAPIAAEWGGAIAIVMIALLGIYALGHKDAGPQERQFQALIPISVSALGVWNSTRLLWEAGPAGGLGTVLVTGLWLVSGALMLGLGLRFGRQDLRQGALALFALTAGKVLLVDLASLDTPWRILASGGLGAVLIAVSWLYGRLGKEPSSPSAD